MRHFDDATPIFLLLAEDLRAQILGGELAEGARLTSTTEYATRYRINPATANKAVALLVDEGLVVKRRGIGMFVVDGALADLRRSRRAAYTDDVLHPALDTGLALGLDDAELRDAVVQYLESHARKES